MPVQVAAQAAAQVPAQVPAQAAAQVPAQAAAQAAAQHGDDPLDHALLEHYAEFLYEQNSETH